LKQKENDMYFRVVLAALLIFGMFTFVAGQSGRRVNTAPTPIPSAEKIEAEAGYSDSAPNRAIPIYARSKKEKKKKPEIADNSGNTDSQTVEAPQTTDAGVEADNEVITVESAVVTIPVSVHDRNGIYIPGLYKENFKIFENGKEQEIAYFGTSDKPFTVVLLLDVSSSALFKIEEIRAAATAFIDELKPVDSVMVISFDDNVNILAEPTTDRQKIYRAINRANFGGGTSLYDAVATSLGKRLDKIAGKKAIVLFTDGVDTTSRRASYESTLADADEADAMIFPIYYNTFFQMRGITSGNGPMSGNPSINMPGGMGGGAQKGERSEDYVHGRQYLNDLADLTGGKMFRPESTPGGLNAAFRGIAEELRRQYNIGYYPSEIGVNGDRKQIRVRVNRPNLIIRSRDSYIVGATAK
jgi:VWFA-related protein